MREKPKKYIDLNTKKVEEIAGIKKVSTRSVYSALRYQTNSTLAMLIRAWALNNGGVIYEAKESDKKVRVL